MWKGYETENTRRTSENGVEARQDPSHYLQWPHFIYITTLLAPKTPTEQTSAQIGKYSNAVPHHMKKIKKLLCVIPKNGETKVQLREALTVNKKTSNDRLCQRTLIQRTEPYGLLKMRINDLVQEERGLHKTKKTQLQQGEPHTSTKMVIGRKQSVLYQQDTTRRDAS